MLAKCPICVSKFISSTDDITATQCGHTFHYSCILQWLQTSKSCPQCRNKTSERSLLKLFFDIQSDSNQEDIGCIQNQNDSLQFQITLKNKENRNAKEKAEKLEEQITAIRSEVSTLNDDIKKKGTVISALKMQVRYANTNAKEVEDAKKKAREAESLLRTLLLVKKIYSDNYAEIEGIINDCGNGSNMQENLNNLATISTLMQKKLHDALKEKSKSSCENVAMRRKLKDAEKSLSVKELQIDSLQKRIKLLKEDINSLESENSTLSKNVSALQDAIISPSGNVKNKIIKRLLTENVVPENLKKLENCEESISEVFITPEVSRTKQKSSTDKPRGESKLSQEENSPYVRLKSCSVNPFATTYNKNQQRCFSKKAASSPVISKSKFFQFRPPLSSKHVGYDGLGGHHEADEFLQPGPMVKKLKRVNIVSKGKCISSKIVPVQKINEYFKNTFEE